MSSHGILFPRKGVMTHGAVTHGERHACRNRVWLHSKGFGGVVRGNRLCSKRLCCQVSEPWGHLSLKMFLEARTADRGKIRKSQNKSWAPCAGACRNALTLEPLFTLASEFSNEVLSQAIISYSRVIGNQAGNGLQNKKTLFCHITLEANSAQSLLTGRVYVSYLHRVSQPQGSPPSSTLCIAGAGSLQTTFPRLLAGSLPMRVPQQEDLTGDYKVAG